MSNGDEESDEPDPKSDTSREGADGEVESVSAEEFEHRLEEIETTLADAETEDDLDEIDQQLDAVETDLDEATLEAESEDEESESDVREDLEDELSDLREDVDSKRGPYLEDITDVLSDAETTIETSEWTEVGIEAVGTAVREFATTASENLESEFGIEGESAEELAGALSEISETIGGTALDPDDDADLISVLLERAEELTDSLEDAQVFDDLEVREQLDRLGFYDVLNPETLKDFPPEWSAVKQYEARKEVEPLLTAFDKLESDFMEANIMDALEHLGAEEAFDEMHGLAKRRNKQPVRILGRIGDERACETLEGFLGGGDISLEKHSLRALGAIGSEESTEPVAQRLAADNPSIRATAARSLGLIGDTRAIEPLSNVLQEDDANEVRASAAWALNQIGTARALESVAEYVDDSSYLVQVEAEKATST